jgi:hypothetical protein
MRPLLALLLCLAILGIVGGYLRLSEELRQRTAQGQEAHHVEIAAGKFSVEVTLTFDAGGASAFALEPTEETSLLVLFQGRELIRSKEPVAAGAAVRVEDIQGIASGKNEFYLEAHPSDQAPPIAHAVRVRVLRDGHPIADETLWSEPGLPVRGTVRLDAAADASANIDDHTGNWRGRSGRFAAASCESRGHVRRKAFHV